MTKGTGSSKRQRNIYLSNDLWREVKVAAAMYDLSASALIEGAIEEYLKNLDKMPSKANAMEEWAKEVGGVVLTPEVETAAQMEGETTEGWKERLAKWPLGPKGPGGPAVAPEPKE